MMAKAQESPILVVGGSGKTGRRVVERLVAKDRPTRIAARSGDPRFDWADRSTWPALLEGVAAAYLTYYPDLAFPGASERVRAFADLAVANDVRRLVLLSGRNEDGAQLGEQAVQESGADWTVVRSSMFNQDFSEAFFLEPLLAGELAFPAGNVAEPFIDADDIADIVVEALTDDRHVGQLYEVTGPRLLTFSQAVAAIAEAAGREMRYVPISAEEFAAAMAEAGLPPQEVKDYTELFTTILDGRSAYLADGVQRALGRAPRDFANWARATAATGVWAASAA